MRTNPFEVIKKISQNQEVIYIPNPGNAGDALIAYATLQGFKRHDIQYRLFSEGEIDDGHILVYGGGGNFIPFYKNARTFFQKHAKNSETIFLLPHTVVGNEDVLSDLDSNCYLFCRELISYEHVAKHAKKANVFAFDDLAIGTEISSLSNETGKRQNSFKENLGMWGKFLFSRKELNCFRKDKERTSLHKKSIDVPSYFMFNWSITEAGIKNIACDFLSVVNKFDTINSNRLHVGIAGGLLGKNVNLFPNSYFKNEAVFHFSLKDRFPNINWIERS